jgi:glycosyltransferase involved in cell wall biosynthesis
MLDVAILTTPQHDGVVSHERFARELLAALRERGGINARVVGRDQAQGARSGTLRDRGRRTASRFIGYPRAARRLRADVFHLIDQSYGHLVAALPAQRVVATCHDLVPMRAGLPGAGFTVPRVTRARCGFSARGLRRAAHVACVSEATRTDVIELLGIDAQRTSVVPNGLAESFRPLSGDRREHVRAELGGDAKLVLHVSSGAVYKNVEGTLEALARLRASEPRALLVRVGAALTDEQRTLAARLGVSAAVRELGRVDDERLVELYNAADAMLFPSHWEGFGWPALEALACGTPTDVSDCAPLRETVGNAALAAPARDPDALAAAVLELWSSPALRDSLRERGLQRAAEFSWRATAARYAALYEQIAARATR